MEQTETLNITKVNYTDKKKDGTPIVNKYGKPSYKTGILTKEYGDKWLNGFLPFPPDKWEGTEQKVIVYDDEQWGKQFKLLPKGGGMNESDKASIVQAVRTANAALAEIKILRGELIDAGVLKETTSNGDPMPDFDPELASLEESAR